MGDHLPPGPARSYLHHTPNGVHSLRRADTLGYGPGRHGGPQHPAYEHPFHVNDNIKKHIIDSYNRWSSGNRKEAPHEFKAIFSKYMHNAREVDMVMAMIEPVLRRDGKGDGEIAEFTQFIRQNLHVSLAPMHMQSDASICELIQSMHARISALESR
jgi:hypothetical protein